MPRTGRWGIPVLCLAGIAVSALILAPAGEFTARGQTDFMDLYAGGKLAFTGDLYAPERVLETEARFEGMSSRTRLFLRLPCFALLLWPIAQLPYSAASALWEALCLCALPAFIALWPARWRTYAAPVVCWSLPAWMAVAEGQDVGFIMVSISAAAALFRRKRPAAAGFVASLCLAKFHLFLLIPVWICARREWRFAKGLAAGSALLFALCFVAGGVDWPLEYFRLIREPANNPYQQFMPNLHGLVAGLPGAGPLELVGIAAIAWAVWIASCSRRAEWGLAAALAGGVLVAPHAYLADGALLIPAWLLMRRSVKGIGIRLLSFALVTPIPWVLVMIGAGQALRLVLCALVFSIASLTVRSGLLFRTWKRGTPVPDSSYGFLCKPRIGLKDRPSGMLR
jgi:hypothetical protein